MLKKFPPYQIIATLGSLLLIAYVVWAFQVRETEPPDWTMNAAIFVSALVAVMTLLGIGKMVMDYRQGYLFPLRNATLYLTILTALAIPVMVVWELIEPYSFRPATLLLLPVFLFVVSRNLFRIKVDNVAMEAKLGLRPPVYTPLFNINSVEEDEQGLTIRRNDGGSLRVLRVFFFKGDWDRMRERLLSISTSA